MTPRVPDFQKDQVRNTRDLLIFISTDYYLVEIVWAASLEIILYSHILLNAEAEALKFTYSLKNLRELKEGKGPSFCFSSFCIYQIEQLERTPWFLCDRGETGVGVAQYQCPQFQLRSLSNLRDTWSLLGRNKLCPFQRQPFPCLATYLKLALILQHFGAGLPMLYHPGFARAYYGESGKQMGICGL